MKTHFPTAAIIAISLSITSPALAQSPNTNTQIQINDKTHSNRQILTPQSDDKLPIAWENKDGIVRLSNAQRDKNAFWYPNTEISTDGTLYASMKIGKKPDSSIMYRATFPQNPALVSGYSLSFDHQYVLIHRWENGFAVPVTGMTKIKKWPEKIDIIIQMRGNHVDIKILNAKSKTQLAHLESNDAAFKGNQTGYRIYRKQDKITGFTHLSFEPESPSSQTLNTQHPDAYIRQHPNMYVMVPQNKVKNTPALQHCKHLKYDDFIENYDVYRCGNKAMMMLVDKNRLLPDGFYWTEPRTAFTDDEFRKAAKDLKCKIPMRCNPNAPIQPNKSAKDAAMTYAYLNAYVTECQKRFKYVRLETIGQSYLGYDIKAIVLSNSPPETEKPRVLFNGAHHGMELLSIDMAFDILEQICETTDLNAQKQYENTLNHIEAWIIPTVNLDGNDMFMHVSNHLGRKNGRGVFIHNDIEINRTYPQKYGPVEPHMGFYRYRPNGILIGAGVDINRNYPLEWGATGENSTSSRPRDYWYRGTAPATEPEIQAMMNLFHTQQFAASISFHTVSTKILVPYSIESLKNPTPEQDNAWQLALKMANAAGTQASGKPYQVVNNLYAVDGTDQDWFRMISGTYAYLIEGALHNPTGNERTKALTQNRPAWQTLFHATPSSTIVRVRDNHNQPLIAEVSYSDIPQLNQEHWLTRCQDGTHSLLCFGERTITVKLSDGTTQTKTVNCNPQKPTIVDFVFQKPLQYNLENATINSGVRPEWLGIDAICHMRNGTCPQLPANQFCLIQNECIQAGHTQKLENEKWGQCQPRENNRDWTPITPQKIQENSTQNEYHHLITR